MRLRGHAHNDIVTAIVDSLKSRSTKGLQTCFYKVKAHKAFLAMRRLTKQLFKWRKGQRQT